jgi:hypothetical protein
MFQVVGRKQVILVFVWKTSLVWKNIHIGCEILGWILGLFLSSLLYFEIGSQYIVQADLEFSSLLSQPLECWDYSNETYSPSYSGGRGKRIAWAWEFKADLGNRVRASLFKNRFYFQRPVKPAFSQFHPNCNIFLYPEMFLLSSSFRLSLFPFTQTE